MPVCLSDVEEGRKGGREEWKAHREPLITYPSVSNSPILSEVKPISPLLGIRNPSRT